MYSGMWHCSNVEQHVARHQRVTVALLQVDPRVCRVERSADRVHQVDNVHGSQDGPVR